MNYLSGQPSKPPKVQVAPPVQPAPTPIYIPQAPTVVPAATPQKVAAANADTVGDNEQVSKRRTLAPTTVDRLGTILTSGQGVTSSAPTTKKVLLGG